MSGTGPVLAAFGNPLLDIIVDDVSGDLVRRFKLESNVAQEMDTKGSGLCDQVLKRSFYFIVLRVSFIKQDF